MSRSWLQLVKSAQGCCLMFSEVFVLGSLLAMNISKVLSAVVPRTGQLTLLSKLFATAVTQLAVSLLIVSSIQGSSVPAKLYNVCVMLRCSPPWLADAIDKHHSQCCFSVWDRLLRHWKEFSIENILPQIQLQVTLLSGTQMLFHVCYLVVLQVC